MKKILLTGSTSFIGSKFLDLYKTKFDIFGVSKRDKYHSLDILDFESLKKLYIHIKPDVIIHTAAIVDQDLNKIRMPNIQGTKNIVEVAKLLSTPIIFTSSESVYGGKENVGGYKESDLYLPRSVYGETKAESEKIIIASGLPYLITRCHRFIGINKKYDKPKQFPDTLKSLANNQEVHLDSHRLFKPCLVNNISDVFVHYIENDTDKKIILNLGVDKPTTYYNLMVDVAEILGFDKNLIKPDGQEINWPENSTLDVQKLAALGYPALTYKELLSVLKTDWTTT